MAARFEATVITVAAIGVEESAEIVMDSEDILGTPVLGDLVKKQMEELRSRGLLTGENFIAVSLDSVNRNLTSSAAAGQA